MSTILRLSLCILGFAAAVNASGGTCDKKSNRGNLDPFNPPKTCCDGSKSIPPMSKSSLFEGLTKDDQQYLIGRQQNAFLKNNLQRILTPMFGGDVTLVSAFASDKCGKVANVSSYYKLGCACCADVLAAKYAYNDGTEVFYSLPDGTLGDDNSRPADFQRSNGLYFCTDCSGGRKMLYDKEKTGHITADLSDSIDSQNQLVTGFCDVVVKCFRGIRILLN